MVGGLNGRRHSNALDTCFWIPSWEGTDKFFLDFEDAQSVDVSDTFPLSLAACIYDLSFV